MSPNSLTSEYVVRNVKIIDSHVNVDPPSAAL